MGLKGTEMEEDDQAVRHLCKDRHGKMCVTRQREGLQPEKYVEPGFNGCETDPEVFDAFQLGCDPGRRKLVWKWSLGCAHV